MVGCYFSRYTNLQYFLAFISFVETHNLTDCFSLKKSSVLGNVGEHFKITNYISNMDGPRKTHAMQLGDGLKDIAESMRDGLEAKEHVALLNLFQLKPARHLFDKLLDLLNAKSIQRHMDRQVVISKIDVEPIFHEFLDECREISSVSYKLREKIDSRMEKIASMMSDILVKISDLKPNLTLKDRMDGFVEKVGSNKPNIDLVGKIDDIIFLPKNYLINLSGRRKAQAIYLGECLKDISETMHDNLSSAREKILIRNIFKLKATRKLFDKLLELLKEKSIDRQTRREVIISKIEVKPIVDEFLDECGKIVTITDKLRDKVDSRAEKMASTLTGILEKTTESKLNFKDRVNSVADKIGSMHKSNIEHFGKEKNNDEYGFE